jgi:hypothetical protein
MLLNTNEISMYHKGWMVANNIIVKHLMDYIGKGMILFCEQ